MKRRSILFCIVMILAGSISADENLYDGLYDRPTYFPDFVRPNTWPNNMSYLVQAITASGDIISNYEVAVNDALRATGRSRTADGQLCMLTISGTEGDTFHFEVIYGDFDDPTIKAVPETCSFITNDVVGGEEPFQLTLPVDPTVAYWLDDVDADTPTAEVALAEVETSKLQKAVRISLNGSWETESVADLLDGCTSLLYVEMNTMPGTTDGAFTGSNPNCLVFLPTGTAEAPEGWTNCIADGKALTDINLEDGTTTTPCPFYCPIDIDLNDHCATFQRTEGWKYADGNSGWNTVVIPFDAELQAEGNTVSALPGLDLTSPQCNSAWKKEAGYWACPFMFSNEEDGLVFGSPNSSIAANTPSIAANTPYLFAMPGKKFVKTIQNVNYSLSMEDKDIVFVSTGETLPATPASIVGETEEDDTDAHFVGTYQVRLQQPMWLLKSQIADGYDAFVYSKEANLLPFRAYIEDLGLATSGSMRPVNVGWRYGGGTDIAPVEQDGEERTTYDLTGRRTDGAHGIVIINNKKILLKP